MGKLNIIPILLLFICACGKEPNEKLDLLKDISSDTYYSTDVLSDSIPDMYGAWKVAGTSGGIHGGGYPADFDYLLMKPNSIFGLVRNDSLLTTGRIELAEALHGIPALKLHSELDRREVDVNLLYNTFHYVVLEVDTLSFLFGCCDGFDTHFVREE